MQLQWTTLAKADLEHIHEYISRDRKTAATAVVAAIRKTVRSQLPAAPFSGRIGRVENTRELVVPRLPYVVVYRVTDSLIQILRVLHEAQRWPHSF